MLLIFNLLTQIPNFYFFSNKFKEVELGTIFNSLCHASLVCSLSIYYLLNPQEHIYQIISSYSQVYLMIDLLAINYFPELKKYQKIYTIHHSLFLLSYYLVDKDIYKYIICKLLLAEISVIFMDLRFISKFCNYGYLNELSYITYITFFIFRILNMPLLVYQHYIPLENVYGIYMFVPMYSLQLYWFYNMTLKVLGYNNKNE
jgi:hypothetical protein